MGGVGVSWDFRSQDLFEFGIDAGRSWFSVLSFKRFPYFRDGLGNVNPFRDGGVKGEYNYSPGNFFCLFLGVNCCLVVPFALHLDVDGGRFGDNFPGPLHPNVRSDGLRLSGVVGGGGELWDFREHGGRHFMI